MNYKIQSTLSKITCGLISVALELIWKSGSRQYYMCVKYVLNYLYTQECADYLVMIMYMTCDVIQHHSITIFP